MSERRQVVWSDEGRKELCLISGFGRENTINSLINFILPMAVLKVIFTYYHIELLEWNTDKFPKSYYKIITDHDKSDNNKIHKARNNTIKYIGNRSNSYTITAKKMYVISSKICEKFYCEITLINLPKQTIYNDWGQPKSSKTNINFCFGYIDATDLNLTLKDLNHMLGYNNIYEYGVNIDNASNIQYLYSYSHNDNIITFYNNGRIKNLLHTNINRHQLSNGDKIALEIDFIKNKSYLYYNDKCLGVAFINVPQKIIPAITLFYSDTIISCTKFELFTDTKNDDDKINKEKPMKKVWQCNACTFYNDDMNSTFCEICNTQKPSNDQLIIKYIQ